MGSHTIYLNKENEDFLARLEGENMSQKLDRALELAKRCFDGREQAVQV